MDFFKIATTQDFTHCSIRSYSIFGKKIGIVKRDDGSFFATEVGCKHQGIDLTTGTIKDHIATCPCHQWQYDLESGECLNHDSPPLKHFPLKIENDAIKIALISC